MMGATVAVAMATPIILFPAAFVWYLNIGASYRALRKAHKEKAKLVGAR